MKNLEVNRKALLQIKVAVCGSLFSAPSAALTLEEVETTLLSVQDFGAWDVINSCRKNTAP